MPAENMSEHTYLVAVTMLGPGDRAESERVLIRELADMRAISLACQHTDCAVDSW